MSWERTEVGATILGRVGRGAKGMRKNTIPENLPLGSESTGVAPTTHLGGFVDLVFVFSLIHENRSQFTISQDSRVNGQPRG